MDTNQIMADTKRMIDDLKTVCGNFGLGNAPSEYKIITEVFLYKYLNDKFLHEIRLADDKWKNSANWSRDTCYSNFNTSNHIYKYFISRENSNYDYLDNRSRGNILFDKNYSCVCKRKGKMERWN